MSALSEFQDIFEMLPPFDSIPCIQRVLLFGSRARHDNEERSDIDLAIQTTSVDLKNWDQICTFVTERAMTLLPFNLIWLNQASETFRKRIESEGVVLYERKA